MEKEYSLSSLFTRLYSDCNVKTKNEFINFVKSRRVNSHICLNYITKKDISFQFTDYVNDTESIVCKECYLNVLEKFQNLKLLFRNSQLSLKFSQNSTLFYISSS